MVVAWPIFGGAAGLGYKVHVPGGSSNGDIQMQSISTCSQATRQRQAAVDRCVSVFTNRV